MRDLAIAAALGEQKAQYDLGVAFFAGRCVDRDYAKAATLWRKLIEHGDVLAHNNLGYLTYYGHGVDKDERLGVQLWRFAAERGNDEAQQKLARAYLDGRGIARDAAAAWAWAMYSLDASRRGVEAATRSNDIGLRDVHQSIETETRQLVKSIERELTIADRRRGLEILKDIETRRRPAAPP